MAHTAFSKQHHDNLRSASTGIQQISRPRKLRQAWRRIRVRSNTHHFTVSSVRTDSTRHSGDNAARHATRTACTRRGDCRHADVRRIRAAAVASTGPS